MTSESSSGPTSCSASDLSGGSQVEHLQSDFELKEYETQFFGFTPKSFSDGLYNAIMEYMSDYLGPTINTVKLKCGLNLTDDEVKNIQSSIQQTVEPSIDKAFDKMEVFLMQNVLNIPAHVLLEEDKIHDDFHSVSHKDVEKLEQEIKDIQNQIAAKKYVNECLRRELEESTPVLDDLDALRQTQKVALNTLQKATKDTGFEKLLRSTAAQLQGLDEELSRAAEHEPQKERTRSTDEPRTRE